MVTPYTCAVTQTLYFTTLYFKSLTVHFILYCKHQKLNKYHHGNISANKTVWKRIFITVLFFYLVLSSDSSAEVMRKIIFPDNIRISGLRMISVRKMTKLQCSNYCSPTLVPQGSTVSLNVWLTVQFGSNVGTGSWNKRSQMKPQIPNIPLPQTQTVVVDSGGFSCCNKMALLKRWVDC